MDEATRILDANAAHAQRHVAGALPIRPARKLAVVACMDSRIDVFDALGLKPGEAHVLRNAGGVITDDMIRSVMISQRMLGTREIVLIHHTDCGLQKVHEQQTRDEIEADVGAALPFALEAFTDVDDSVRRSIGRIQASPFVQHKDVRGFVYDVATGLLREVH